jgi:hypothetical protein
MKTMIIKFTTFPTATIQCILLAKEQSLKVIVKLTLNWQAQARNKLPLYQGLHNLMIHLKQKVLPQVMDI